MIDLTNSNNLYLCGKIILNMYRRLAGGMPNMEAKLLAGPSAQLRMLPKPPLICGMEFWYTEGGQGVLVLGGVDEVGGYLMFEGWLSESASARLLGCNTNVFATARDCVARWLKTMVNLCDDYIVIGHSGGGAVACMLPYIGPAFGLKAPAQVVSFGAPACLGGRALAIPTNAQQMRIMGSGDGVPSLPFARSRSRIQTFVANISGDYAPWKYQHSPGGLLLTDGGYLVPGVANGYGPDINAVQVGLSLVDYPAGSGDNHDMVTYVRRLEEKKGLDPLVILPRSATRAIYPTEPELLMGFIAGGEQQAPETVRPMLFTGIIAPDPTNVRLYQLPDDVTAASNLPLPGGGSVSFALEIPMRVNAKLRKPGTFYVIQEPGAWYVAWHNEAVATFSNGSAAKTCAKYWNKALRTLGKADQVNSTGWQPAIAAFLASSGTQSGGFIPPLRVT